MNYNRTLLPASTHIWADLSRAELHVLAPVAGDEKLIEVLDKTSYHKWVINQALGIPIDEVTEEQKSISKVITYSLIYSAFTAEVAAAYAARDLGRPVEEMLEVVFRIMELFPRLTEWVSDEILSWYDNEGWITYLCNARKKVVPLAYSKRDLNSLRGSDPARVAINQIGQNSIGLLLKMMFAKFKNHPILGREDLELLQAFDACGFIVPTQLLDKSVDALHDIMTTVLTVEDERTGQTHTTIIRAEIGVSTQGYAKVQSIPKGLLPDLNLETVRIAIEQPTEDLRANGVTAHYEPLSHHGLTHGQWIYWKRPANADPTRKFTRKDVPYNPNNPFANPLTDLPAGGIFQM